MPGQSEAYCYEDCGAQPPTLMAVFPAVARPPFQAESYTERGLLQRSHQCLPEWVQLGPGYMYVGWHGVSPFEARCGQLQHCDQCM